MTQAYNDTGGHQHGTAQQHERRRRSDGPGERKCDVAARRPEGSRDRRDRQRRPGGPAEHAAAPGPEARHHRAVRRAGGGSARAVRHPAEGQERRRSRARSAGSRAAPPGDLHRLRLRARAAGGALHQELQRQRAGAADLRRSCVWRRRRDAAGRLRRLDGSIARDGRRAAVMAPQDNRSLGELMAELSSETSRLVRKEVELATTELTAKTRVAGGHVATAAIGGALTHAGLLVLLAAIVIGLAQLGVTPWLSAAIVALA